MHHIHAPGYSDFFASGMRCLSKRFAMEDYNRESSSPKPIPLSFDSVSSDSDSEMEITKWRAQRRMSILSTQSKSSASGTNVKSHSHTAKAQKQRHRRSSLISITHQLFGNRKPRSISGRSIPNDESGWVSSASSDCSFEEPVDFMDLSTWPECPNGGLECLPQAVRLPQESEPEVLDPFSSSPRSKSYFVDVDLRDASSPSRDDTVSIRNTNPTPSSAWSNRFSFSSISSASVSASSFFSSSSRRYSGCSNSFLSITSPSDTPPPDASFLHFPRPRSGKRNSMAKRPASIHVFPSSASSPSTTTTTATSHPRPHTCSYTTTLPVSQPQTARSRVRSFFPSRSRSISAAIPENDHFLHDNDIDNAPTKLSTTIFDDIRCDSRISVLNQADSQGDGVIGDEVRPEIADEEAYVSASDARYFLADDVPAQMDWREFCIEVLDGHSSAWA